MVDNPNPNKANQHRPDPRQALFLENYLDPKSKTFGNAMQSAISAGYDESYAKNLMGNMPTWLSEKMETTKTEEIVEKAQNNLIEFIKKESEDPIDKKIKADMTKFALERLAKKKYSVRQELTGEEGQEIKLTIIDLKNDKPPDNSTAETENSI